MVEMRWIEVKVNITSNFCSIEKKLQYRLIENFLEFLDYRLQKPIWSDWKDVPTVEDKEN